MLQLKFIKDNKKTKDNPKRFKTKNICACKLNYFIFLLFILLLLCIFYKKYSKNPEEQNDVIRLLKDNTALQEYIFKNKSKFGNKADMKGLERFFGIINDIGLNKKQSVVFVGGTNDGEASMHILNICNSITFYGFEIQIDFYKKAKSNLLGFKNVHMQNLGWSDKVEHNLAIGGIRGTAGLYDPKGQRGWKLQKNKISTVLLSSFVFDNNINETIYVLIDTEGHEPNVLRGMNLNLIDNQKKFPIIQYELGGTWAKNDNRHNNDPWDQKQAAIYLEQHGYKLFLIGEEEWLYIESDLFNLNTNKLTENEGYGAFIQGNVLAVHTKYTNKKILEKMYKYFKIKHNLKFRLF